jgi:hypothetical protein
VSIPIIPFSDAVVPIYGSVIPFSKVSACAKLYTAFDVCVNACVMADSGRSIYKIHVVYTRDEFVSTKAVGE